MDTNQLFLETAEKQFIYYKRLGERAMAPGAGAVIPNVE